MNEIILGKGSLYSGAWNTRSDTVHHHDSRVFNRLFDDGAVILTNHGTLDDGTRRPRLFDTLIRHVASIHEVVSLEEGCRKNKSKCVNCDRKVDGTEIMIDCINSLNRTTRETCIHRRVNRGCGNVVFDTNLRTP